MVMSSEEYKAFNEEMSRLRSITWKGYAKTLKEIGVAYIGAINASAKLMHNGTMNMLTYGIYLAASDLSGINVCARSKTCREACLVGSGRAKIDALSDKHDIIDARIIKTRLFFANREIFMRLVVTEIKRGIKRAEREGKGFSVRLNCTSDINPLAFRLNGKNVLELFPNVMFYDYTKVPSYIKNMAAYDNYYVTFSRDGSEENEKECMDFLAKGGNVAVVFGVLRKEELPKTWRGYGVLCGDDYDYRPWDKLQDGKQIVGLVYKVSKNDFERGRRNSKFKGIPKTPFIIQPNDADCEW